MSPSRVTLLLPLAFAAASAAGASGCAKVGCLAGDDPDCVVPSPCPSLAFEACDAGSASLTVAASLDDLPGGPAALGAVGDYVLRNDRVVAVIEAIAGQGDSLGHPHYLAPTGGALVDLASAAGGDDALNHFFQATGLLPEDAVAYDEVRTFTEDGVAAVQFRGRLDGREEVLVATRYEVRACEPGVRVRTEIVNLSPDPFSLFVADAWYWGGRGQLAFVPYPGGGFEHPSFGLSTVPDAMREAPYMVGASWDGRGASYAAVACDREALTGFHSEDVSAAGVAPRIVMPRDYEVYERFVAVAGGGGVSAAADVALDVRQRLFGEAWVVLSGRVELDGGGAPRPGIGASVHVSSAGADGQEPSPVTHAVPDAEGSFQARVPADRSYHLEVESHGRVVASADAQVGGSDADAGALVIPRVGRLRISASVDGAPDPVLAFVRPADDETAAAVRGALYGEFEDCAPLLGSPHGGSPACDRVLVEGQAEVDVPAGTYDVVASSGPFSTLARAAGVRIDPGGLADATLELVTLPVQPVGTLSGDFHVHGGTSFDSSVPDDDRVKAFLAARMQVIASTDHDAVWDYAAAMDGLGAGDRLRLLVGVETTGHILWRLYEGAPYPQVVGHWNFWPVPFDPSAPWRGAAWDELMQPGELFTAMRDAGWSEETGVIQLNHPIADLDFGRDLGFGSTAQVDATLDLATAFDGTPQSLFLHHPEGADFGNADYHTQEVMNGTDNTRLLSYRAFWFYLLSQGVVRAGTANSDSHGLTDNVLGTPRTLVWADTTFEDFDADAFNEAVRDGRMVGTNGPVLDVVVRSEGGDEVRGGLRPLTPEAGDVLVIRVAAAPWVPVDEVRVVVDGTVARTYTAELSHPADLFGSDGLERLEVELPLSDLSQGSGDHWIVVEAGAALPEAADLSCDGLPDTGDNNGDGSIDWRDVEELEEEPDDPCLESTGPLLAPRAATDRGSAMYWFQSVVPLGYPASFTNPFLLDADGDGYEGVGR